MRSSLSGGKKLKLSAILRQQPSLFEGNRISVVEKYITHVDPLPDRFLDIEVLFLSHNSIASLAGFKQFRRLRVLSMASNCVEDFEELEHLRGVATLQILNLDSNPVTLFPNYRYHVTARLPRLKQLDNKEVRETERAVAERVVRQDDEACKIMFGNHYLIQKLERIVQRIKLHAELLAVVYGRVSILNRADPPEITVFDTKRFLQYWDYESCISHKEVNSVYTRLRLSVVRMREQKKEQLAQNSAGNTGSTYDKFKALADGQGLNMFGHGTEDGKLADYEMWENDYKIVMMQQQNRIGKLLSIIEDIKHKATDAQRAIFKQMSTIAELREEQKKQETSTKLQREALILEFRDQISKMSVAQKQV